MVNLVDTDGTGNISFPEFLKIMEIKSEAENFEVQISEAFRTFDQVGRTQLTGGVTLPWRTGAAASAGRSSPPSCPTWACPSLPPR